MRGERSPARVQRENRMFGMAIGQSDDLRPCLVSARHPRVRVAIPAVPGIRAFGLTVGGENLDPLRLGAVSRNRWSSSKFPGIDSYRTIRRNLLAPSGDFATKQKGPKCFANEVKISLAKRFCFARGLASY